MCKHFKNSYFSNLMSFASQFWYSDKYIFRLGKFLMSFDFIPQLLWKRGLFHFFRFNVFHSTNLLIWKILCNLSPYFPFFSCLSSSPPSIVKNSVQSFSLLSISFMSFFLYTFYCEKFHAVFLLIKRDGIAVSFLPGYSPLITFFHGLSWKHQTSLTSGAFNTKVHAHS